jgi:ATP-dependent DNA helicase DinG
LQDARVLQVGSPFDYPAQAALYVPTHLPRPTDPGHSAAVASFAARSTAVLGGATLVLTTTLRALRTIALALQQHFQGQPGMEVLVQGEAPKRLLMERFRIGRSGGKAGCVLVASASFWEGFDVPGDALQLVLIDKLPFPPPNDPLVEARLKRIESLGRNGFSDYSVPEAAIALKQGAGRLIRRESDFGILVVCDSRLVSMGYGRRLRAALPPMTLLTGDEAYQARLEALARGGFTTTSTMD